jgi:SEC-C motif
MPGPGRNDPCPCGSGRKVKRCCGQQRGPSEEQLARAHVALLARDAARDIADLPDDALDDLWDGLFDLPAIDLTLLVTLPKLIGPDLQHLLDSVANDDPDWDTAALIRVAADVDTFQQRAQLADALVRLRDQHRITRRQAAAAILHLDSSSRRFINSSLLEAIALAAGAIPTPGGLQIAA